MDATITDVEAWPLRIPLRQPMRLASETITHAETLLVRVVASDGTEGWGEASAAPTMTGDLLPGMTEAVRRFLAPALVGQPCVMASADLLPRALRGNSGPKAGVEAAFLDLLARRAGITLAALLGTKRRTALPAIRMSGESDPDATLAHVAVARTQGFTHVKLKIGMATDPVADAALARRARDVAGTSVHLSADANMAWSQGAALTFLHALGPGVLNYLEQPVRDDDLDGMAACVALAACPICMDEGLHGLADIAAHAERRAANGVGLKAIKLGGILATLDADALARRHGLRTTLACKIAETSVGAATLAQIAAVVPEVEWGVSFTQGSLAEDVVAAPLDASRGLMQVPDGPGIGVAPDMNALRRFAA